MNRRHSPNMRLRASEPNNIQIRTAADSKSSERGNFTSPNTLNSYPVVHKQQPKNRNVHGSKVEEKCVICETPTFQCCSLCRKVFYCCQEHQEVDWHMKHKFNCEGRPSASKIGSNLNSQGYVTNSTTSDNKFIIYDNLDPKSNHFQSQNEQSSRER